MWHRVNLVWTEVSEERIAFIFTVEKSVSEEPVWAGGCILSHQSKTLSYIRRGEERGSHWKSIETRWVESRDQVGRPGEQVTESVPEPVEERCRERGGATERGNTGTTERTPMMEPLHITFEFLRFQFFTRWEGKSVPQGEANNF
jgi:hypothetical protein